MREGRREAVKDARLSFAQMFTPKLVTVLREGYGLRALWADIVAGLTVAIVALPLSMAIAIACGLEPQRGLYAAVVGGFLVSALGGSRFQVGGPAGAFIVLVAAAVMRHGVDGMLLATFLSGVFLLIAGLMRLGDYVKYIPYPVTVGFTAGIAMVIAASQIPDLFGLAVETAEGGVVARLAADLAAAGSVNPGAVAVAAFTVLAIFVLKRFAPKWPAFLIALALATAGAALLGLPVETVGSAFGAVPHGLPAPALPDFSFDRIRAVMPDALAFTLLGAVESLLSAVVADGMTGRRHRSNCELAAQGIANMAAAVFGAMPVTGTIARTATNVRAGARGPVAGMLHAVFVLALMAMAAPLLALIPLAALAGLLLVVAWNMVEKHAILALLRSGRGETAVLAITLLLTVFRDLSAGIIAGSLAGMILILHRLARTVAVEHAAPLAPRDRADAEGPAYDAATALDRDVVVYRFRGALFFGAAGSIGSVLDRIAERPERLILDFADAPFIDATGANMVRGLVEKAARRGAAPILTGLTPAMRATLRAHGVGAPRVRFANTIELGLKAARRPVPDAPPDGV